VIVEWLVTIGSGLAGWFIDTFMVWSGPQPEDVFAAIEGFAGQFASLGVWLNWAALIAAVGLAISVWLACLLVKGIRALIAHFPQFGGAG
jgi:hypothetical protein